MVRKLSRSSKKHNIHSERSHKENVVAKELRIHPHPEGSPLVEIFYPQNCLGDFLVVWAFLNYFHNVIGLPPCASYELAIGVTKGKESKLLGDIHIGLLKVLLASSENQYVSGGEKVSTSLFIRVKMLSRQTMLTGGD